MFVQTTYSEQLTFFQKLRSFDYILLLCIVSIGIISGFSMYSTDGGELLYHSRSHITRLGIFFIMMVFIWIMAILPLQKWSNIIEVNSIFAKKSNLIRINMVEFFNWEDPVALSESYLKQLSQP